MTHFHVITVLYLFTDNLFVLFQHLCKSYEVLNEAYEVVQLSYCNQNLLVSTLFRSIICQKHDKLKVCQVGKKDRKV